MITTEQLEALCADIHQIRVTNLQRMKCDNVSPGEVSYEIGRKYARIVLADHGSRSVHSFVDMTNGNLLKSESWAKPHRTPRGNISDPARTGVGPYGMAYLR